MFEQLMLLAALISIAFFYWCFVGYYYFLLLFKRPETADDSIFDAGQAARPKLTLIVPSYNEAKIIEEKVQNTLALAYPRDKLRIIFCDGGSDDGTVERLNEQIGTRENCLLLRCPAKGKINQLNHALEHTDDDIIVHTDVDARLPKDALERLALHFAAHPDAGAIGTWVEPETDLAEERQFWRDQNAIRALESLSGNSSVVIAAAYAYRRQALEMFPVNVIADDVYIAFESQRRGLKTYYFSTPKVIETRAAPTMMAIYRHKFRKAHANLKELGRFVGSFAGASKLWRVVFYTKMLQTWLAPLLFLPATTAILLAAWFYPITIASILIAAVLSMVAFSRLLTQQGLQASASEQSTSQRSSLLITLKMFIVAMAILLAAVISYPWSRQDSCYSKVQGEPRAEDS
jgi:biofilm PGA synthesis N-glycosyltransferase PgaC